MTNSVKITVNQVNKIYTEIGENIGNQTPRLLEIGKILNSVKNIEYADTTHKNGKPLSKEQKAKAKTAHEKTVKANYTKILKQIGFSNSVANKFIAISKDEYIVKHAKKLPCNYNLLYSLVKSQLAKAYYDNKDESVDDVWKIMLVKNKARFGFTFTPNTTQREFADFIKAIRKAAGFNVKADIKTAITSKPLASFKTKAEHRVIDFNDIADEQIKALEAKINSVIGTFNRDNETDVQLVQFNTRKIVEAANSNSPKLKEAV